MNGIIKHILLTAAFVPALFSCRSDRLSPTSSDNHIFETIPTEEEVQAAQELSYVPGESIIKFDERTADRLEKEGAGVLAAYGITSAERVFEHAGEYEERTRREGLHLFYKVTFDPDRPVTKATAEMKDIPGVKSVDPVRKVHRRSVFNDPYLGRQWNYINTGHSGADINVKEVWEHYTTGSSDVIVAVVDGGVQTNHPDLDVIAGGENGSRNFVRRNYTITADDHGTHVAGTIAAINNNGKGVCGIAGGNYAAGVEGVRILSCQIFEGESSASESQTINAIKWGADHGALISQNSWGYYADTDEDGTVSSAELAAYKSDKISEAEKLAIDYFIRYAGCNADGSQKSGSLMKGGIVVFAAGNEDIDYDIIGAYDPVISVGAYGSSGSKASYSNYGAWVDLAAPGGDYEGIYSTLSSGQYGNSIIEGGYRYNMEGTSMACPHVSGVAALIVSFFGGEGFTAEDLRHRLVDMAPAFSSSRPIGAKLDALSAFSTVNFSRHDIQVKAHATETVGVIISDIDDAADIIFDGGSEAATISRGSDGTYSVSIVGRNAPAGRYAATLTVNYKGGASYSDTLEYEILENHAPVVSTTPENRIYQLHSLGTAFSLMGDGIFSDPDGETPSIEIASDDETVAVASMRGDRIYVQPVGYGACNILLTATDELGLSASASFQLVIWNPKEELQADEVTDGSLVIRIEDKDYQDVRVEIINAAGSVQYKTIKVTNAFDPVELDLNSLGLPPGVYTIRITYAGETYTRVFVKK